jgi:hypothetical protein
MPKRKSRANMEGIASIWDKVSITPPRAKSERRTVRRWFSREETIPDKKNPKHSPEAMKRNTVPAWAWPRPNSTSMMGRSGAKTILHRKLT